MGRLTTYCYIIIFMILGSCGANRPPVDVSIIAPGEYLVIDRNCTAIVRMQQARRGARKNHMFIRESEGYCHVTNITLGEHLSETYGMIGTFEEGERVYIWPEDDMEKMVRYLLKYGLAQRDEE